MAEHSVNDPKPRRRDPTARKRPARRAAGRIAPDEARIDAVLAAFAHDIRTPLTGILALSDLLATSGLGERERAWVAAIGDAADHLAELTTLIVEGAHAGAGRASSRRDVFDLPRLAYTLAASLAARAEAKNLVCEIDIADDLPAHVRGDAVRLRSAIENLIANAVKFTAEGRVGLAIAAAPLKRDKVRLTFMVSDSGIGISATEMKRLFRPFAQANRGIVQKFGGSGLGLVQVRRLAKAMHGDLAVESVPGRGSIFRLAATVDGVPADQTEAPEHDGMVQATGAPRQLSILCVEDNPYGRVVMNAILTELGHRVAFAGSGTGAVDTVARGGHDAVLIDVSRAGLDGFNTARRIRRLPGAVARVPIIGISGRATDADAALAAGMNAHVVKPISPRGLADSLVRVLADNAEPE